MVVGTRDEAERLLSKALSRHIGYTSGAYDLGRIFATLQPFADRTSAYKDELVAFLREEETSGPDSGDATSIEYRGEILSFATSMGLLEAVSSREAKLVRYAATELGRSVLGAHAVGDTAFYQFYSAKIVLRADADFIVPVLTYLRERPADGLIQFFAGFANDLRNRRFAWLLSVFPERVLFERVASQISWLKRKKGAGGTYEVDVPTLNTARHHATPRNGWIEQLGMYDKSAGRLTAFGMDVVRALTPKGGFFWLAPPSDALDALGLTSRPEGQAEDSLSFHEGLAAATEAEATALVEDVRSVMAKGYRSAKLVHASQASLQLPIEYVSFRSYRDKISYDWEMILEQLFQLHRSDFQRYSARKGKIGFYKMVRS